MTRRLARRPRHHQEKRKTSLMSDRDFLKLAIDKAKESVGKGGFPAGAIVVKDGKILMFVPTKGNTGIYARFCDTEGNIMAIWQTIGKN
jgi:hypothetical protein